MSGCDVTDSTDDFDLWKVQLSTGEVRLMTLDQLDSGFQEGWITEDTRVLREGATQWATLADVAGLGGEEDLSPAPVVASVPVAPTHVALAPVTAAARNLDPFAMIPVAAPSYPPSVTPHSLRPMVSEIDDLEFEAPFRQRKSGGKVFVALIAVAAVAGMGVALTHGRLGGSTPVAVAAAPMVTANVVAAIPPPPPVVAPSEPQPNLLTNPFSTPSAPSSDSSKLTDQQKRALADADKTRDAQHKARAKASATPRAPRVKTQQPFHKGGSQYDPLNAKL
jgi:hypothetical protein